MNQKDKHLSEIDTEDENIYDDELDDEENLNQSQNNEDDSKALENENQEPILVNAKSKKRKVSLLPRPPRAKLDANRFSIFFIKTLILSIGFLEYLEIKDSKFYWTK